MFPLGNLEDKQKKLLETSPRDKDHHTQIHLFFIFLDCGKIHITKVITLTIESTQFETL